MDKNKTGRPKSTSPTMERSAQGDVANIKEKCLGTTSLTPLGQPLYIVGGEKGGVGKSFMVWWLVEALWRNAAKVHVIDADAGNQDVAKIFDLGSCINVFEEGGNAELINEIASVASNEICVVSLPALFFTNAKIRGEGLMHGLSQLGDDLGREVIVIWLINETQVCVELLRSFLESFPSIRVDVFGNEFYSRDFSIYENSRTARIVEERGGNYLRFPKLLPSTVSLLTGENKRSSAALKNLPLGNRHSLQAFIKQLDIVFQKAGYIGYPI